MAEYKFYRKQVPASELIDKLVSVVSEVAPACTDNRFQFLINSGYINFLGGKPSRNDKPVDSLKRRLSVRPVECPPVQPTFISTRQVRLSLVGRVAFCGVVVKQNETQLRLSKQSCEL